MDDPLVPKTMGGGSRMLLQGVVFLAVVFVLVACIISVINGFVTTAGWFFCGTALALLMGSTGMFVRWIMSGELSESKHTYLVGFQCFSLILLGTGNLAVIYNPPSPQYLISGCAANVNMDATIPRPLQLILNQNETVTMSGPCAGFAFESIIKEGDEFSIAVQQQPTGALCGVSGGSGKATQNLAGKTGVGVNCNPAYMIAGSVLFGGQSFPTGVFATNQQGSPTPIQGPGNFFFPQPFQANQAYFVEVKTQNANPPVTCVTTNGGPGSLTSSIHNLSIICTLTPTQAPPPSPPPSPK